MYSYQYDGGGERTLGEQSFLLNNIAQKVESPNRNTYFGGDWSGQWIEQASPREDDQRSASKSCLKCLFPGRTFSDEWEQLADSFIYPLDRQRMCVALFMLFSVVTSLSVIELTFDFSLTVNVMCNLVFSLCFILMFLFVCTPFCKQRHFLFVRIMTYLSCLTYATLIMPYKLPFASGSVVFSPGDRLWEIFLIILVVYVFVPLPYMFCILLGTALPCGFAAIMYFQRKEFYPIPDDYVFTANLVILVAAANIIGIVTWCIWNRYTRRLLIHVREYALAGVELEKENEKFDRVLTACFPPNIGVQLKSDIVNGLDECTVKERITNYESVTMMLVELVGFDRVLMGTLPRDKAVLINKLFTKLCELSEGYACACLNADNAWTLLIVSGIIHPRSDHARACLHLAFDMLDFVSALSETAGVPLRLRITVHSGGIACGLVGKQRWVYDAWSHDLVAMQRMHESAVYGQVQISRETLAFFGGGSDIQLSQEPNVVAAAAIADRFVVRPNRPPRLYGFTDVLSSYPDRHLLAPTQLLLAALESTSPLNCTQFPMFGGQIPQKASPVQLLTAPIKLPDEEAFALNSIRQLLEDFGSTWVIPTVSTATIYPTTEDGKSGTMIMTSKKHTRRDALNPCTMQFRNSDLEREFEETSEPFFAVSLISCLALHSISTLFHCLVLPKTILFLTLSLFTFINFLIPLFTMLCNKLGCFSTAVQHSARLRMSFCFICLGLAYLTAQVNVLTCKGGMFDRFLVEKSSATTGEHRYCPVPSYIATAGVLIICMPMLFTHVLALVKTAFALMVAFGFSLVIEYTHRDLFVSSSTSATFTPSDLSLLLSLAVFVVLVYFHGRLLDRLERIAMLWQRICAERHAETSSLSQQCRRVLNNVLPEPALTCLVDSAIPMDNYSENQDNVAVAVLSLENLPQPSSLERRLNTSKTIDSFRLLTQVIYQIDELLTEGRFRDLVKVRSVGSHYVVAVGLYTPENLSAESVISQRLSVAIDFVLAVRQLVVMANSSTGSEITVQSGVSIGSVTCGVIACRTLYFDIFSNTVKTALQMADTCKPEYVQVSETVYTYTRYLYRYYSRKRMNVDPIGEFFAYRLIGTRAMYRNGPLGLGPLIGGGLTRQGSRESGVSLLSQATSVWSQAATQQNRQIPSFQQPKFMPDLNSNRLSEDETPDADSPSVLSSVAGSAIMQQSDQNGNFTYFSGSQFSNTYSVPFREGNRNVNMTQLSAVPEMEASGHEQIAGSVLANTDTMEESVAISPKREEAEQLICEEKESEHLKSILPNLFESAHDSPRSQVSHYDNQNSGSNAQNRPNFEYLPDIDDKNLSEMPDMSNFAMRNFHPDFLSQPSAPLGVTASSSGFSLPSKATSSRHSLQQQQYATEEDADIEERLAALDELDRKIRESVAQLRCAEEEDVELNNSKTLPTREPPVDAARHSIPFIDDSHLKNSERPVLPDLVRPPQEEIIECVTEESDKFRAKSADYLLHYQNQTIVSPESKDI